MGEGAAMDGTRQSPHRRWSDRTGTRFFRPLLQLKHRDAAFDQRISVDRWPDTLRASIEMPNPEHPFKIADRFGYRGLLHARLRRRFDA
jgi:hypothetical protein